MSGYSGNPDAEAEQGYIFAENNINAARSMLIGPVLTHCNDCGERITEARRQLAITLNHTCQYCITCQPAHDKPQTIRMLDHIL